MTYDEVRQLVNDGLTLRRNRREAAEREARMEEYEKNMITFCNGHCADAKKLRQSEAEQSARMAMEAARAQEQREQYAELRRQERERLQKEMERNFATQDAVRCFVFFCLVTALVTVWTPFPWWAAVALVVGMSAIAAAYVFRIYFPAER